MVAAKEGEANNPPASPKIYLAIAVMIAALGFGAGFLDFSSWATGHRTVSGQGRADMPKIVLWAWECPEDLRFLNAGAAQVAFLAGTIEITHPLGVVRDASDNVVLHPRLQPLLVPPGTALTAVIRIETPNDLWHSKNSSNGALGILHATPAYHPQESRVADIIASIARLPGIHAVQIDYDAARSEQAFYKSLLESVRTRLLHGIELSMTALASWCLGDRWLDSMPRGVIDEAVPMLFRMGPDANGIAAFLESGNRFPVLACRTSLGISTDEAFSRSLLKGDTWRSTGFNGAKRIYIFSNRPWSATSVNRILMEMKE